MKKKLSQMTEEEKMKFAMGAISKKHTFGVDAIYENAVELT